MLNDLMRDLMRGDATTKQVDFHKKVQELALVACKNRPNSQVKLQNQTTKSRNRLEKACFNNPCEVSFPGVGKDAGKRWGGCGRKCWGRRFRLINCAKRDETKNKKCSTKCESQADAE